MNKITVHNMNYNLAVKTILIGCGLTLSALSGLVTLTIKPWLSECPAKHK